LIDGFFNLEIFQRKVGMMECREVVDSIKEDVRNVIPCFTNILVISISILHFLRSDFFSLALPRIDSRNLFFSGYQAKPDRSTLNSGNNEQCG
jgi:hypothetical protein